MNRLFEIAEHELSEAVEVKNKESLHRYIEILQESFPQRSEVETDLKEVKSDVKILAETMKQGFEEVDKRFQQMDKRFEDIQHNMDKRFEDIQHNMDKRFNMMFKFISLGFSIVTILIVVFKFLD